MEFTPHDTRLAQLAAAESFCTPSTPPRITLRAGRPPRHRYAPGSTAKNFSPPRPPARPGAAHRARQRDLDVKTEGLKEPVLGIEDVTERFQRHEQDDPAVGGARACRPAVRVPRRKRRVGFLLSSVERFFSGHQEQVTRGMNFSQVSDASAKKIVRRARRLAVMCHCAPRDRPPDRAEDEPFAADDPAHAPQARPGEPEGAISRQAARSWPKSTGRRF